MAYTGSLVDNVIAAMADVASRLILPRYQQLSESDIRAKSHAADMVTIADEEAERDLAAKLATLLPGSQVVGEEAVAADPAILPELLRHDPIWIVDPIDGIMNFIEGRPLFATMIALVSGGETVLAWIHDPLSGRTMWAEKGKGCWRRPPRALSTPTDTRVLIPAEFKQPEIPLSKLTAAFFSREFAGLKGKFAHVMRQGSAAHDYWASAEGRLHVIGYKRLKPWDHAAGLLIHQEAGGHHRLLSGVDYSPVVVDQHLLLCAPTPEIWQRARVLTVS